MLCLVYRFELLTHARSDFHFHDISSLRLNNGRENAVHIVVFSILLFLLFKLIIEHHGKWATYISNI